MQHATGHRKRVYVLVFAAKTEAHRPFNLAETFTNLGLAVGLAYAKNLQGHKVDKVLSVCKVGNDTI